MLRIGGLVVVLVAALIVAHQLGWLDYRHTLEHVDRLRRTHSVVAFMVGYVVAFGLAAAIGMPALPFTVVAGVLFGTLLGAALAWLGAMLAALIGYWTARSVARDVVLRWVKRYKRAATAVDESRDFAGMLRLRLIPVLPLGVVNFVGGLARAHFGAYIAATAVGILPAMVIYAYFADSLLERVGNGRTNALVSLVVSSVLLILLSFTPKLFAKRVGGGARADTRG